MDGAASPVSRWVGLMGLVVVAGIVSGCASSSPDAAARQAAHRLAQHCANVASVQLLTVDDEGNAWIGYTDREGPAEFDRCIHLAVRELERRNAGGESVGPGVLPVSKRD